MCAMGLQNLTFYELDLGLNHVVRKYSEPLEDMANMLIAGTPHPLLVPFPLTAFLLSVPGGSDGPSGVLVCCENYILYKNFGDQPDIRCPIPRRKSDLDDAERSMILVCSATHKTKVCTNCFVPQSLLISWFSFISTCTSSLSNLNKAMYSRLL